MFFYDKKLTISILLYVYVYTYCTVVVDKLLLFDNNRTFISFRK